MKLNGFCRRLFAVLTLTLLLVTAQVPVGSSSNQALAQGDCSGLFVSNCNASHPDPVAKENQREIEELKGTVNQLGNQVTELITIIKLIKKEKEKTEKPKEIEKKTQSTSSNDLDFFTKTIIIITVLLWSVFISGLLWEAFKLFKKAWAFLKEKTSNENNILLKPVFCLLRVGSSVFLVLSVVIGGIAYYTLGLIFYSTLFT